MMKTYPAPCPNCKSTETYIGERCGYVICRKCGMTGPVAPVGNDEEAVKMWNALPRETGQLEQAQARIQHLVQTLNQVHQELRIGPAGDGLWRMRAMQLIKSVLEE